MSTRFTNRHDSQSASSNYDCTEILYLSYPRVKKNKVKEADCNFVLFCTVRNVYVRDREMKFKWNGIPQNNQEFLKAYGDSFIADVVEGGEFVALVSSKAKDSSNVEKIKAELSVALSVVQGQGQGQYDTTAINNLAKTEVMVKYSGAAGLNLGK
jgi:hypothetical protein